MAAVFVSRNSAHGAMGPDAARRKNKNIAREIVRGSGLAATPRNRTLDPMAMRR
jgi:hypothetical protein